MVVGDASVEIDVLVIGAGPGGYVAAIRAAQLGKSVLVVDKEEVGGVCLNRGCIPSKALISAAHQYEVVSHAESIGITAENVKVDFGKVQAWKDAIVKKQTGGVGMLLKGNKIQYFNGEALFINEHEARLFNDNETARYRFNACIIATGSRPIELKAFPYGGRILSSTEALKLSEVPKSLIVIGGGYIGIELGQTYAKFGTKVTVLEGSDFILPGFEKELTRLVERNLKKNRRRHRHRSAGAIVRADGERCDGDVYSQRRREESDGRLRARYGRTPPEHRRRIVAGARGRRSRRTRLDQGEREVPNERAAHLRDRRHRRRSGAGA